MQEQIMYQGTCTAFHPDDRSFVVVTDGYHEVYAYVPTGITVMIGKSYQLYKHGNTYHIGSEVQGK